MVVPAVLIAVAAALWLYAVVDLVRKRAWRTASGRVTVVLLAAFPVAALVLWLASR